MTTYKVIVGSLATHWYNSKGQLHRENGPAVEHADGYKEWWLNGQRHRENGPAIEYTNGYKEWWLNDKRHRKDGPAVERADGSKSWYINGQRHRENGPAVEWANGDKEWWLNGQRHCKDGPAIEHTSGYKEWYINGKRHRADGPAVEYDNGHKEWWLNGEKVTEDEVMKKSSTNISSTHPTYNFKYNLKEIIDEVIKEIDQYEDIKKDIELYKDNSQKITELQKSIQGILDQIKTKTSEENIRLKRIIKFMEDFNLSKLEGDKWVATLEEKPMYKEPSISYKEVYEAALKKLNAATVAVIKQLESAHLADKAKIKKKELIIKEENFIQKGINWLIDKWKNLLLSMNNYKKVVDEITNSNELKEENQNLKLNIIGNRDGIEQTTFGINKEGRLDFIRPEPKTKVVVFSTSPHKVVKKLKKLFPNVKDIWITPYKGPYNGETTIKAKYSPQGLVTMD
jgi:hypothetical protein